MKKTTKLAATIVFTMGFLIACNSGEDETSPEVEQDPNTGESQEEDVEDIENEENEESEEAENEEGNTTEDISSGDVDDQLDLGIGDTAIIDSTIGTYEITLNSVDYLEEVDGQNSDLDIFLLANYTLKNVGEETINTIESINTLETTDMLDASGYSNVAGSFESVDAFEDTELGSGEEMSGEVLFNSYDADEFYIRAIQGLVASGGLKNDVLFTIEKSEIQ